MLIKSNPNLQPEFIDIPNGNAIWEAAMSIAVRLGPNTLDTAEGSERFVNAAIELSHLVPAEARTTASRFSKFGNNSGMLVFRGLDPPESVKRLDTVKGILPKTQHAVAAALVNAAVSSTVGKPFSANTLRPPMIDVSMPGDEAEGKSTMEGSGALGWHSEGGQPLIPLTRPRAVSLFCIRGQADAENMVIPAERIIEKLSAKTIEVLQQPRFKFEDGMAPETIRNLPSPLLTYVNDRGRKHALISMGLQNQNHGVVISSTDEEAVQAHRELMGVINQPDLVTSYVLNSGEILLFDNSGVHNRTGFSFETDRMARRYCLRNYVGFDAIKDFHPIIDPGSQPPKGFLHTPNIESAIQPSMTRAMSPN